MMCESLKRVSKCFQWIALCNLGCIDLRVCGMQKKGLGMCLGGQLRSICSAADMASWQLIANRFQEVDVVVITNNQECDLFVDLLQQALANVTLFRACFDETEVKAGFQHVVEHVRLLRDGDNSTAYYVNSNLLQAYSRLLCARWVRSREQESVRVQYDWLLFSRVDVDWISFPEVSELKSPHPLLWTHFRSADMMAPHSSDRFHIGAREIMLTFLENLYELALHIIDIIDESESLKDLFLSSCLPRLGETRFMCTDALGSEDFVEFICMLLNIPYRMHAGMCFNSRSNRFETACGATLENNCRHLELHPQRGFVIEHTKQLYMQPFSWDDDYDNLLALTLHSIMANESRRLGRKIQLVDVGAGIGTYVSGLQRFFPDAYGVDGRLDILDVLGENAILHDLTKPIPRVLRHGFDWLLMFNTADHLPRPARLKLMANIIDLPRVGIIADMDESLPGFQAPLSQFGFTRDHRLESVLVLHAGLLCCRDLLRRIQVFRRRESIASAQSAQFDRDPRCSDMVKFKKIPDDWCGNGDLSSLSKVNDIGALNWYDYKVPAGNVIWGTFVDDISELDHQVTVLYLKFARLCFVDDARLGADLETMEQEWNAFSNLIRKDFSKCAGPRTLGNNEVISVCNKIWGCFQLFERISARLVCGSTKCKNEHMPCPVDANVTDLWSSFFFSSSELNSMRTTLAQFSTFHVLSNIANCRFVGDWPPIRFYFEPGFRVVKTVSFERTNWGKYLFRIHNVAGVRS